MTLKMTSVKVAEVTNPTKWGMLNNFDFMQLCSKMLLNGLISTFPDPKEEEEQQDARE